MPRNLTKNRSVARDYFKMQYDTQARPGDGRQPVPVDVADKLVKCLSNTVPLGASVAVYDSWFALSLSLKEAGYTDITLIETKEDAYLDAIKPHAAASGIKIVSKGDVMNFDVIIGNPPYSDRSSDSSCSVALDSTFFLDAIGLSKAQSLSGSYVSMIIRSKHFNRKENNFRRALFSTGHVVSITALPDKTFPILNTPTCVVTWDSSYNGKTTVTYTDGTVREIQLQRDTILKLDSPDYIDFVPNNLADSWVRGKLTRSKMVEGSSPVVEILGRGETPVIRHIVEGSEETARNTHGVVINVAARVGGLGRVMIKPYGASICGSVVCVKTKTEEEARLLQEYLLSPEVTQLVKENMPSFAVTKTLFSRIPSPF